MTKRLDFRRSVLHVVLVALLAASASLAGAHGDGEGVEEFHLHVDDFEAEVAELAARADALVAEAGSGDVGAAETDALIEAWEAVAIHEAIELRATPLYPGVWQALVGLKVALEDGEEDAAALEARADAFRGALLEGLGGVKLAAAQARASTGTGTGTGTGSSTGSSTGRETSRVADADGDGEQSVAATIEAIRGALEDAVAYYENDDLAGAEARIHDAYMQRFEGLEDELIALDAELVSTLEMDFNATLPLLMQEGADRALVHAQVDAMNARLERAEQLLEAAVGGGDPEIF